MSDVLKGFWDQLKKNLKALLEIDMYVITPMVQVGVGGSPRTVNVGYCMLLKFVVREKKSPQKWTPILRCHLSPLAPICSAQGAA